MAGAVIAQLDGCDIVPDSIATLFKGRENVLAEIRAGFEQASSRPQAITARHAIHGLGGIGKTRLAIEYAWRYAEHYGARLFVRADTPSDLTSGLVELAELLGLAEGVGDEPARVQAVLAWLRDPANAGWLLIVDNLDSEQARDAAEDRLQGLSGGHLLLTGRLNAWPAGIHRLRLDVLETRRAWGASVPMPPSTSTTWPGCSMLPTASQRPSR